MHVRCLSLKHMFWSQIQLANRYTLLTFIENKAYRLSKDVTVRCKLNLRLQK